MCNLNRLFNLLQSVLPIFKTTESTTKITNIFIFFLLNPMPTITYLSHVSKQPNLMGHTLSWGFKSISVATPTQSPLMTSLLPC
jgi:hypothetical protein